MLLTIVTVEPGIPAAVIFTYAFERPGTPTDAAERNDSKLWRISHSLESVELSYPDASVIIMFVFLIVLGLVTFCELRVRL